MAEDNASKGFSPKRVPSYDEVLNCIRCGLCLSVCPTYREAGTETNSPRGRVALVRAAAEGKLELSHNFVDHMYRCLNCMACAAVCPSGVEAHEIVVDARVEIDSKLPQPAAKKWIFKGLVPYPGRMEAAAWPLRLYQRSGLRWLAERTGALKILPFNLGETAKMPPTLPMSPLRGRLPEVTPAQGERRYRVGFFLGCAQSLLYAESSEGTVRVLSRNGAEVVTPKETVCCGMPAMAYGDQDTALALARQNIDLFEKAGVDVIVTDCATCGESGRHYEEWLKHDPVYAEKAAAYSKKFRDISEFLAEIPLDDRMGEVKARVTYHDPCHLVRGQKVAEQPRKLLQMIPGVEFVEMKEANWCCGGAGTYMLTHYQMSMGILDRKIANVAATDAEILASGCPVCQMQLGYGVRRAKLPMKVTHPVALLDRAYRSR
ncbi:MAG: (Fe-S)-binding protein [Sphingomonadaceae bacterium]